MNNNYLVSVIVPIYNVQDYIGRCIESILRQSFQNLEILLVNDGSIDNSRQICEAYANKDKRIKIIDKENGGLSDARNVGIKAARGDYIVLVDGDDYIKDDYVWILLKETIRTGAEVTICSFDVVDDDGNLITNENLSELNSLVMGKDVLDYVLTPYGYKYVVAWNKMYSAQVFENNLFDKGKLYEDEYLNFRLFWEIKSVAIVHTSLYCYVQRQGSITQSDMSIKKIKMKEEMHKCRISFYKEHRERHLYMKSCQMYCNWLVECVRQYSQVLQPVDKRRFQLEMRKYSRIADDDKEFGMAIRIQNYVGRISLRLASFLKEFTKVKKMCEKSMGNKIKESLKNGDFVFKARRRLHRCLPVFYVRNRDIQNDNYMANTYLKLEKNTDILLRMIWLMI